MPQLRQLVEHHVGPVTLAEIDRRGCEAPECLQSPSSRHPPAGTPKRGGPRADLVDAAMVPASVPFGRISTGACGTKNASADVHARRRLVVTALRFSRRAAAVWTVLVCATCPVVSVADHQSVSVEPLAAFAKLDPAGHHGLGHIFWSVLRPPVPYCLLQSGEGGRDRCWGAFRLRRPGGQHHAAVRKSFRSHACSSPGCRLARCLHPFWPQRLRAGGLAIPRRARGRQPAKGGRSCTHRGDDR